MYLNKAYIIGNLTRDPELKALPNGSKVASFSLATNRIWKDKNGEKQENVEFHNIVVFGLQAETASQYLKKGQQTLVEGRIQTRSWDKDGVKMYRTEIVAENIQFGSKKQESTLSEMEKEEIKKIKENERANAEFENVGINADNIPF